MKLSIILPVFNSADTVLDLINHLRKKFSFLGKRWEIIAVDDGSGDSSWNQIVKAHKNCGNVLGVRHSRNFGQHAAITTGLRIAAGKFILVMDSDFQDRPEDACRLYWHAQEGWDVVQGRRINRKDSWTIRTRSKVFHALFRSLTGLKTNAEVSNFSIYSRRVVSAYLDCPEKNKVMCLFVSLLGFRQTSIPVRHQARTRGKSGYTWLSLLRLAGITITRHSKIPLYVGVILGFLASGIAVSTGVWILVQKLYQEATVPGWASLGVLFTFLMGTMFSIVGILGIYIGALFDEVRARPEAIISEKTK